MMRYEIWNLMDDGKMELAFSSNSRSGIGSVAKAMAECAKRDRYEYKIVLWDSVMEEKIAEYRNF